MATFNHTNGVNVLPSYGDFGTLFADLTVISATAASVVLENAFGRVTLTAAVAPNQFGTFNNGVPSLGSIASLTVQVYTAAGVAPATLFTGNFGASPVPVSWVLYNYGYGLTFNPDQLFNQADTINGSAASDWLQGRGSADRLVGNAGDDTLDGGNDKDTMVGGAGDDVYVVNQTDDVVTEAAAAGIDTVAVQGPYFSNLTYTLPGNVENGEVNPAWLGQTYYYYTNTVLTGNAMGNILRGSDSTETLNGAAGNDRLFGGGGNDVLDGGTGADVMAGGLGGDVFRVDAAGDRVYENHSTSFGPGYDDEVESTISFTLPGNVEILELLGAAAINGTGNTLDNRIIGNSGNNLINGGAGVDTLSYEKAVAMVTVALDVAAAQATGGGGTDTVTQIENLIGGSAGDRLRGSALANRIDGGGGNDTMTGLAGNDTFVVGAAGDSVVEAAGGGTDGVEAWVNYTLGNNLENLTLFGFTAVNGVGNTVANMITGNELANFLNGGAGNDTVKGGINFGHDTIDGGTGADSMEGGSGNDTYYVDNPLDIVVDFLDSQYVNEINTVYSSINYAMPASIDNLILTGAATTGSGNAADNIITVNGNNNIVNGGLGMDTVSYAGTAGGVNVSLDTTAVQVTGGSGSDVLRNFENLIGGNGADTLTGSAGANVLDGGAGTDRLIGGLGDDTYVANASGDVVIESAGEGMDRVMAGANFTLGAEVEKLSLTGALAINGTGNGLDNTLIGNIGMNVLSGGMGNDTLSGSDVNDFGAIDTLDGGDGNDTYLIGSTGDVIVDSGGTDRVQVFSDLLFTNTYTMAGSVENAEVLVSLSDYYAANVVGNALNNVMTGHSRAPNATFGGSDNFNGMDGNDTLIGGGGADTLTGGAGNDVFVLNGALYVSYFGTAYDNGFDTITDFSVADDTIHLEDEVFTALSVLANGTFTAAHLRAGAGVTAAADADDRIIYNSSNGALYYDADGNGAQAVVQIAQLSSGLALTAADFVVV